MLNYIRFPLLALKMLQNKTTKKSTMTYPNGSFKTKHNMKTGLLGMVASVALAISACSSEPSTVRPVESGAAVETQLLKSGTTTATFPNLGGASRAIRGAVANHYWTGPELITAGELAAAPRISGFAEGQLMATEGQQGYAQLDPSVPANTRYRIYRGEKSYYDLQARQDLGTEITYVAEAYVVQNAAGRATLQFANAKQEIRPGDLLLNEQRDYTQIVSKRPQIDLIGRIIATVGNSQRIGPQQVVTLNLGNNDEIKPGHLLGIYDLSEEPSAATMIGELVIVRVYGTLSYGLVTRVRKEIPIGSQVANPATSL